MDDNMDPAAIKALIPDFAPLPERSDSYFLPDPASIEISLRDLVSTRLRPDGVRNAARLMTSAYQRLIERRAPISVTPRGDGKWNVLDGNSTVAVARVSGWVRMPCKVMANEEDAAL